jgi:hypothetical protein
MLGQLFNDPRLSVGASFSLASRRLISCCQSGIFDRGYAIDCLDKLLLRITLCLQHSLTLHRQR